MGWEIGNKVRHLIRVEVKVRYVILMLLLPQALCFNLIKRVCCVVAAFVVVACMTVIVDVVLML